MCKPARIASLAKRLREAPVRRDISLYCGCFFNWLFAIFRMLTGLVFASPWDGAIAIYYIVLGMMRLILIQNKRAADQIKDPNEKRLYEYSGYRQCGFMMFALNVCATGIIVQIIRHNEGYTYPKSIIGIYAIYTLVMWNIAFFNLIRYKKCRSPNFSAAKAVSFSMAFMAILSLQTAMIAQFGAEYEHAVGLNISLSSSICITLFSMAIAMLVRAHREIRRLKQASETPSAPEGTPEEQPAGIVCVKE